ncbi:GTPase IMAP family member 7 [Holothuria leucospilota]|uniref:GTPase IMAP family member 7 n=1 Tax=Holothuria leucospilota TaxID=206669 RepID=A0A9Q1BSW3_HOLLE|nr:GTPase IMAP family member 7 [Holothuria leucospilota]
MANVQDFSERNDTEEKVLETVQVTYRRHVFEKLSTMKLRFDRAKDYEHVPNKINVLIIGKTGSGLSSTGNTSLEKNAFEVRGSYSSVTTAIRSGTTGYENFSLNVIDTPGLFNTRGKDNDEVLFEITNYAVSLASGVHVVLLIANLNFRFTEEERKVFSEVKTLFGTNISRNIITVFTHGAVLLEHQHQSLQSFIEKHADQTFLNDYDFVLQRSIALENKLDDFDKVSVQRDLIQCAICEAVSNNNGQVIPQGVLKSALESLSERQERKEKLPIVRKIINQECEGIIKGADESKLIHILNANALDENDTAALYTSVKRTVSLKDLKDFIQSESRKWINDKNVFIQKRLETIKSIGEQEKRNKLKEEKLYKLYLEKEEKEKREWLVNEQILFLSINDLQMVLQHKFSKTLAKQINEEKGIIFTEDEINEVIEKNSENINLLLRNKRISQEEYQIEIKGKITQNLLKLIKTQSLTFLKEKEKYGNLSERDFITVVAEIPFEPQCKGIDLKEVVSSIFKEEAFICQANYVVAKRYLENMTDVDIVKLIVDIEEEFVTAAKHELTKSKSTNLVQEKVRESINRFMISGKNLNVAADIEQRVEEQISQLLHEKADIIIDAIEVQYCAYKLTIEDVAQLIASFSKDSLKCIKDAMDNGQLPLLLLENFCKTIVLRKRCNHNGECLLTLRSYECLDEWLKTMLNHSFQMKRTEFLDAVEAKLRLESITLNDLADEVDSMNDTVLSDSKLRLKKDHKSNVFHSIVMKIVISTKTCNHPQTAKPCLIHDTSDWLNNWVEKFLETKYHSLYDIVEASTILNKLCHENFISVLQKLTVNDRQTVTHELRQNSQIPSSLRKLTLSALCDSKSCNHGENCILNEQLTNSSDSWLGNLISSAVWKERDTIVQVLENLHKRHQCRQRLCLALIVVLCIVVPVTVGILYTSFI